MGVWRGIIGEGEDEGDGDVWGEGGVCVWEGGDSDSDGRGMRPNSNFVSARMSPRVKAYALASLYNSTAFSETCL